MEILKNYTKTDKKRFLSSDLWKITKIGLKNVKKFDKNCCKTLKS